jgi:hypothetical protein
MVAYAFYWRDDKGKNHLIGILPERRKNLERITKESISNWVRQVTEAKDVFFVPVELDETEVKAGALISLSELTSLKNRSVIKLKKSKTG